MDTKRLIGVCFCTVIILLLGFVSTLVSGQSLQAVNTEEGFVQNLRGDWILFGEPGENGWYISSVLIVYQGPGPGYYKIDDGEWNLYSTPVFIPIDGLHVFIGTSDFEHFEYFSFKIDRTSPVGTLSLKRVGFFKWLFLVNVSDAASGVDRIDYFIAACLIGSVTQAPFDFVWRGWMFVVLLKIKQYGDDYLPCMMVYDVAGNSVLISVEWGK